MINGTFFAIQQLLLTHLQEIEDTSTREHLKYLGSSGMRLEIVKKHRNRYLAIIRNIAEYLDYQDLDEAIKAVRQSAVEFARQSLADGLTIEEATNGISFLKEIIWREIEKAHLLDGLTVLEYHRLNQTIGILIDSVSSQIAYSYHEYYRKAEEEQQQLAAIVNSSEDAIVGKSLNSMITSWNRSAEKMFGYKAAEAIGKHMRLIIPPELIEEEESIIKKISHGFTTHHYQTIRVAKDGQRISVSLTVSPVKNSRGEVMGASSIMRDISLQKKAEKVLQEREELFSKSFSATPVAMTITRLSDGKWINVNEYFLRLTGYGRDEVIGHNSTELNLIVENSSAAKRNQRLQELIKTNRLPDSKFTIRTKNGGLRQVISSSVIVILNGEKHIISLHNDVTEREIAEKALKENQELLDAFFRNTTAGLVIYDGNNRYVRINDHAARLYGVKPDKIIGKSIYDILPEKLARATEERNREVLKSGNSVFTGVYDARLPGSSSGAKTTYWQGVRFPVPLAGGKKGVGVVSMDITKQVEAQEEARRSEEKFIKAFSSNPAAIAMTTLKQGLFSDINQTWIDLLGYSREETIGRTSTELDIWSDDEGRRQFVNELLSRGYIRGWELEFRKKSGKMFTAQLSASIMEVGGEKLVISTLIDITEQKKLERQKDEFLGVASHELKTPVTSIKAYTQILQMAFERKKDHQSAELLGKMDGQIDKLNSLIADLLDVTRIESGKMQFREDSFHFNSLVEEVVEEIQRTTPRHKIERKLDCDRVIYGDRERTGQVIVNLLTNAAKYSPRSQRIILTTHCSKDTVKLCVRDFGIGIPQEKQRKVFERFYRIEDGEGEDTYPGLGLGLYISSEIIKREKGTIWVESEVGKGSTFCFSLPIEQGKEKSRIKEVQHE